MFRDRHVRETELDAGVTGGKKERTMDRIGVGLKGRVGIAGICLLAAPCLGVTGFLKKLSKTEGSSMLA